MMTVHRVLMNSMLVAGMLGIAGSLAMAQEGRSPLFAVLSGGNEVSNDGQSDVGDPNGYGSATVIVRGADMLCFAVLVDRIDTPTGMHIHQESAGSNGPIVIPLTPPTSGNPGVSSGCLEGLDSALLRKLRLSAAGFYINVHTANFPGGAVRGQLF